MQLAEETRGAREGQRAARVVYLAILGMPLVVGLVFSASLLVDYVRPLPVFCDVGGGCGFLRAGFGAWFGVPVPAFGLAGFAVLTLLALVRGRRARIFQGVVAGVGALVAAVLLGIQVRLGTYCKLCVVVDTAMVVFFVGSVVRWLRRWEPPLSGRVPHAIAAGVAALAVIGPLAAGFAMKPRIVLPPAIATELGRTPPEKVCVVDFVDFECPFCRLTHAEFSPVVTEHAAKVRLVRKMVPLKMHVHAMDAARAACCGERMGQGEAFADALFSAEDLSADGCERIASTLGLNLDAFRTCVKDPSIEARIKSETAEFKASDGHGLPTIWIDRQKLEGARPREELESAMSRALRDHG